MEFVHMKDMRAAGFEPVNVLSQYKWQDSLAIMKARKMPLPISFLTIYQKVFMFLNTI